MSRTLKKVISLLLAMTIFFGAAPLRGFVGLEFPSLTEIFSIKAEAATSGYYTYRIDDDKATITKVSSDIEGNIIIPTTLDGYLVTKIGVRAFYNCQNVTSVVIKDNITLIYADAFENCKNLVELTIPVSTNANESAFYGCTNIKKITLTKGTGTMKSYKNYEKTTPWYISGCEEIFIGDGVRNIGDYAFYGCENLKTITISDSVTDIGDSAFSGCESLINVTLGNGVTSIGDSAFKHCYNLTSIVFPDNVTNIGDDAFSGCDNLIDISFGSGLTNIGNGAFSYCTRLTSIIIPNGVTTIGNYSFSGCTILTNITLPDSVTSIGYDAFSGTSAYSSNYENGITYIDNHLINVSDSISGDFIIRDGTITIADQAFDYCENLTNIVIPDSVISIGKDAFYECYSLKTAILGDSVTNIGDYAFVDCYSLTSIVFPDSIRNIGDMAFYGCNDITSITIPANVANIGRKAFDACTKVEEIYVDSNNQFFSNDEYGVLFNKDKSILIQYPLGKTSKSYQVSSNVSTINDSAFAHSKYLSEIYVCDGVTNIGVSSFEFCPNIKKIVISDSVTDIGEKAFYGCRSLKDVTLSENLTKLSGSLFNNCNNLNNVTIPNKVKIIGDRAFYYCNSLTNLIIPDSVISIGTSAFCECSNLKSVTIGLSLESMGDYAFLGCESLDNISVNSKNINFSCDAYGVLFNKDKTELIQYPIGNTRTEYVIPDSVMIIKKYAFYKCQNLMSLIVGNKVNKIEENAFRKCQSLTYITIPQSVTFIDDYVFAECLDFTDLYYSGSLDQWHEVSFGSGEIKATIHFNSSGPSADESTVIEKYKNATITLDQSCYTVKEPNSLTIEGTITCPDGVDGLLMSWSFDEIDVFYTASETTYETISETDMRFSQTFTPKKAGRFKIYACLPNDEEAECTVICYKEAVSAFIDEHYKFAKSDQYYDFLAEEIAQDLAKSLRDNPSYHWNNFISMNFFENYYDIVFAEILTGKTMMETAVSTFNKNCAVKTTTISNEFLRFIGSALNEDETQEFLSLLTSNDFIDGRNTDIYQQIDLIIEANKKDITESFFAKYDIIGASNKILNVSKDYVEWAIECIYFYAAVEAYKQTSEEFKTVIEAVAQKTDNKSLKKTLETYVSIDAEDECLSFAQYVLENKGLETIETIAKVYFDTYGFEGTTKLILNITLKDGTKLAQKTVKITSKAGTTVGTIAQYANGVFTGITLGMAVSELITNSDDYSLNASKCTHAGDFAQPLLEVLNEITVEFKTSKTLENALLFDTAYNLYRDTQIYALESAVNSVYAQNGSVVAMVINKAKSASSYISKINQYNNLRCHNRSLRELIESEYYYVDEKYSGNKVIRVACPVDVYVYDSQGNLALSIENDFIEIFDNRLTAFVQNSEKYICVPLDEEFTIKIVSTDDGEMDYAVFEFDENSEMTREVSKENISLVNGKTFEGKIDNIINTYADNYSLIVTDTQENIAMDNDIDCVPATNISISKSSVELKVGQSQGLVASISPINTTDKYVWISSDESVATVSENGTVNAVGEGCAFIVAMVNDLIYAECEVSVVILKDYTVTWNIDGATTQQTITEENTITKPANPTKSGYTFVGWSPEVPDTMPSYDLTFTAVFEKSYICPDCGNEILGENAINDHIVSEARMKATVKIKNNSGSKTINYGETLCLTAVTTNMPADIKIYWFVDGVKKGEGETFNVSFESGTKTIEVKLVDSNNNVLKNASGNEIFDSESVTVKGGFFQKIISFFKNLFGANRTVVQAFKAIF